jgi:predicted RNase H-like nuclease (RuvC/YqgF family)
MDDKVFNLLEKMYADLTGKIDGLTGKMDGLTGEVNGLKGEVNDLKVEVNDLKSEQRKMSITIETDIKPSIKMCLEELVSVKEKLFEHDQRFDILEAKVDSHDIKIQVIEGGKRA